MQQIKHDVRHGNKVNENKAVSYCESLNAMETIYYYSVGWTGLNIKLLICGCLMRSPTAHILQILLSAAQGY